MRKDLTTKTRRHEEDLTKSVNLESKLIWSVFTMLLHLYFCVFAVSNLNEGAFFRTFGILLGVLTNGAGETRSKLETL